VTLRLTVDRATWRERVDRVAGHAPGLVPVVKGNGYGFGRTALAEVAMSLSDVVAVGTIHELDDLPARTRTVVLTPTLRAPDDIRPILTVGSLHHVRTLEGWPGRVLVKLATSMHRYGTACEDLGALTAAVRRADLEIVGFSVHPPVAGTDDEHLDEIADWLQVLEPQDEMWVSHVSTDSYEALRDGWPDRRFRIRLGTALWHGDKRGLHLGADVLDTRSARAGTTAGYQQRAVPFDATLAMVGAGTAHGVHPLDDGISPFHFQRRRLALLEPPHMHTSMVLIPAGEMPPDVGDVVDVQRPLINTIVDEVVWR